MGPEDYPEISPEKKSKEDRKRQVETSIESLRGTEEVLEQDLMDLKEKKSIER